jgi:hypothetical protein
MSLTLCSSLSGHTSRRPRVTTCRIAATLATIAAVSGLSGVGAQNPESPEPTARLIPARLLSLPGPSDSNSPALWDSVNGLRSLFIFTSVAGQPTMHAGPEVSRLTPRGPVAFDTHPGHGVWFEAVVPDVDGTWYAYYHNEWPAEVCGDPSRTIPRIGAARSRDFGATWVDLGTVLEAPPNAHDCASTNTYFMGGVGDFSVILDHEHRYLYVFYSQYVRRDQWQGVSVARLAWADRDAPAGKAAVWLNKRLWLPARVVVTDDASLRNVFWAGTPIYRAADDWHDGDVDAFWGPSVHWNTHLAKYVMLLNRATDGLWTQEGIYIAYSDDLSDPASWSRPKRFLAGGRWYPQIIGHVPDGTDKEAGEFARFFMGGRSEHVIQFSR